MSTLSFSALDRRERTDALARRRQTPLKQLPALAREAALGTIAADTLVRQAPALGVSAETLKAILKAADDDDGFITEAEFARVDGLAANAAKAGDRFDPAGGHAVADLGAISRTRETSVSRTFYERRAADFAERHPGVPAPRYYMSYGDKYIDRFSDQLYPKLSETGKAWLVQARCNLQQAIENELARHPETELNDERFQDFAYDSHVDAYLKAGLAHLPLRDLLAIGMTPDVRDLFNRRGLKQVMLVGWAVAKAKLGLDQNPLGKSLRARSILTMPVNS